MLYTTPRPARHDQAEVGPSVQGRSQMRYRSETNLKPTSPEATFQGNKKFEVGREPYERLPTDRGSDHGFYRETWPPSDAKRGKRQAPTVETADDINIDYEADSLEERRRRILRRIDWVGTNIQHPIKLRFTVTQNDERLGKRRRITARHQSQFGAVAKPMITSPFAKPRLKQKTPGSLNAQISNGNNSDAPPINHVRISIGGRNVAAGVTSSISHGKSVGGRFVSSKASASDEMLLDRDDINRQHRQLPQERREHLSYPKFPPLASSPVVRRSSTFSASPRHIPTLTPHRTKFLSSYSGCNGAVDGPAAATFVDLEGRIPAAWAGQNNSTLDVLLQCEERINNLSDPSDHHFAFVTKSNPNLVTLRGYGIENHPGLPNVKYIDENQSQDHRADNESSSSNAGYITNVSKQLSASSRNLQSVARDKSRRNGQMKSQPKLLHPIPLTSRTSRVLRSTSSEASTTVAQVGVEHVATRSQILDEEIWKTWVLSSQDDLFNESENRDHDVVSISPGISNSGHRFAQKDVRLREDEADIAKKSLEVSLDNDTSDEPMERSRVESPAGNESEVRRNVIPQTVGWGVHHEQAPVTQQVLDYKNIFLSRPKKTTLPSKPKPGRMENPEEAWMKFILSEDEDDNDEEILQPFCQRKKLLPAPIQCLPESSVIVHLSTHTISSSQPEPTILTGTITLGNTAVNTADFLSVGRHTSNHTTQGSNPPSSDEISPQPSSVDQIRTKLASSFSTSSRVTRKLTFTKPPRFPSSTRGSSPKTTAATAGSPVHIGKGLLRRAAAVAMLKIRAEDKRRVKGSGEGRRDEKWQKRDIYSLESEDDVESIEDD